MNKAVSNIVILLLFVILVIFLINDKITDETYVITIIMLSCTSIVVNTDKDK